jgi:hypothetical protein
MEPTNPPTSILTPAQQALLPISPGTQPDSAFVDPDPSTTYDPNPGLTQVKSTVNAIAPSLFGGIYQSADGVIHLGLTGPAGLVLPQITAAFPSLPIQTFAAQYSWDDLLNISNVLTDDLVADPSGPMVSITPDPIMNTVRVGFTDVSAPAAAALLTQYGSAVSIVPDQPIEPLEAKGDRCQQHAYPDRAKYHQPGYAGLCIALPAGTPHVPKGTACTTGFGMHLPGSSPNNVYDVEGFFTAGHCVVSNVPGQPWFQGGEGESNTFGEYANMSFRQKSSADAGTIVTNNQSTVTYRDSSNLVAQAPGTPPLKITRREKIDAGQPGPLEISGAISGENFGALDKNSGGEGATHTINYGAGEGGYVVLRHIYTATMDSPVQPGDSGSPVFQGPDANGDGTALGILSGANPKNHKLVYYSQIEWAEFLLDFTTNTHNADS